MALKSVSRVLNRLYRRNPANKAFIVDINISRYQDLFNNLDPSPLRKRDLDQDFITYLEESSDDIPFKYGIDLVIHCPFKEKEKDKEQRIVQGVKIYYQFLYLQIQREFFQMLKNAFLYLVLGIVFLFLSLYFARLLESSYAAKILIEGFSIGGWVFVWESLALAAFKSHTFRSGRRRYKRIMDAGIRFLYIPDIEEENLDFS